MVPMDERPDGAKLLAAAADLRFDELWIYSIDRLGRDDVDVVGRLQADSLLANLLSQESLLDQDFEDLFLDRKGAARERRSREQLE